MKIRSGFVSNSSSSSFVIFGKVYDKEKLQEKFHYTEDDMNDIYENGLYDYIEGSGYEYVHLDEDGEWIVGKNLVGTAIDVIKTLSETERDLGEGCRVYTGISHDGEIQLDSY